ncbi:unnamed protein product, partial [Heterosigma akashiwo]
PTKTSAKRPCRKALVLVNGEVKRAADFVRTGDRVELQIRSNPAQLPSNAELPFEMKVVFEDDHCAVVVKPPGISVHDNAEPHSMKTVRACLPHVLKPAKLDSNHHMLRRPLHVNRLDKPTGGLILAAKTQIALTNLNEQFRTRGVKEKKYRAIVVGRIEQQKGVINEPLKGKASVSRFDVVSHTRSARFGWITTVNLYPETGRTHQLRKHMSMMGNPILGDERYSSAEKQLPGCDLCLWCLSMEFEHPVTKVLVQCAIEEPESFQKI